MSQNVPDNIPNIGQNIPGNIPGLEQEFSGNFRPIENIENEEQSFEASQNISLEEQFFGDLKEQDFKASQNIAPQKAFLASIADRSPASKSMIWQYLRGGHKNVNFYRQ